MSVIAYDTVMGKCSTPDGIRNDWNEPMSDTEVEEYLLLEILPHVLLRCLAYSSRFAPGLDHFE